MPSLYFRRTRRPFSSPIPGSFSLSPLSLSCFSSLPALLLASLNFPSSSFSFPFVYFLSQPSSRSCLPPLTPLSPPIFGVGPFRTPQMSCAPIDSISDAQFGLCKRPRVLDHSKHDTLSHQSYITNFSLNKIIYTHTYINFNNV